MNFGALLFAFLIFDIVVLERQLGTDDKNESSTGKVIGPGKLSKIFAIIFSSRA